MGVARKKRRCITLDTYSHVIPSLGEAVAASAMEELCSTVAVVTTLLPTLRISDRSIALDTIAQLLSSAIDVKRPEKAGEADVFVWVQSSVTSMA